MCKKPSTPSQLRTRLDLVENELYSTNQTCNTPYGFQFTVLRRQRLQAATRTRRCAIPCSPEHRGTSSCAEPTDVTTVAPCSLHSEAGARRSTTHRQR